MTSQEEKRKGNSFRFDLVTRDEFVAAISDSKEDKFAKTFVAKCDMLKAWDEAIGYWEGSTLCGAILVTISKRKPKVANLQLLHTFAAHRGKGVGSWLCDWALEWCRLGAGAEYFRVSSELDAVDFYKKYGFKFIGRQKTAMLSMFRLTSYNIKKCDFTIDEYIYKTVTRNGKGKVIELFDDYQGIEKYAE